MPLRDAVERRPPPDASYRNYMNLDEDSENLWEAIATAPDHSGVPLAEPNYSPVIHYYLKKMENSDSDVLIAGSELEPPRTREIINKLNSNLVCYVQNSASNRKEPLAFTPSQNLDAFTCTHVIYAFATVDPHSFALMPEDREYDVVRGGYRACTGMKLANPNLKILLSVGGIQYSKEKFARMVSNYTNRQSFIKSAVDLLLEYGFDGMDFHWQYPVSEDFMEQQHDKNDFANLIEETTEVFKTHDLMVSVGVPATRYELDDGYDLRRVGKVADLLIFQGYDFKYNRPGNSIDYHSPQMFHNVVSNWK